MTIDTQERFIFRASCRDEIGIIADVATFLAARRLFIVETANFGDPATGLFFMRLVFAPEAAGFTIAKFSAEFEPIASKWGMTWEVRDARAKPNVLVLVSQSDHCLNDLLYRHRIGALHMNVPAIVSNHLTCAWLAERHGVPYYHLPTQRDGKEATEAVSAGLSQCLHLIYRWGEPGENPYHGFLANADAIVVTADSVSMISEACASTAAVYIALPELASPKQRMFAETLYQAGHARPLGNSVARWPRPPLDEAGRVAAEIRRRFALEG